MKPGETTLSEQSITSASAGGVTCGAIWAILFPSIKSEYFRKGIT